MACAAPITVDSPAGPIRTRCKQCLQCRIYNQSSLTLQCLLENHLAQSAQFVTLTYADAPDIGDYEDFKKFLKRLRSHDRRRGGTQSIRYLGVGEYGTKSGRFHYHALIWNALSHPEEDWRTKLWPQGYSYIGTVTPASVRYTARYTLKFETKGEESVHGSSQKPPLGETLMTWLGETHRSQTSETRCPPPTVLKWDGKTYPVNPAMRVAWMEGFDPSQVVRNAGGTRVLARSSSAQAHLDWMADLRLGDPIEAQRRRDENRAQWWETAKHSYGKL